MTFDTLGLLPELLRAVRDQGYETPTPVQAQAIPVVLAGNDLIAGAQTGTGKTAAFTLPVLQRLSVRTPAMAEAASFTANRPAPPRGPAKPRIRALILTPTRELCMQVEESVRTYGAHLQLRSATVFGGVNITPQIRALRAGVDILVATPGRLLDHYQQGNIDFSRLEILVLDEADRMLDMGFIRDIRKILAYLPKLRQNLLFSATFNEEIRSLAGTILTNPVSVDVAPRNTATELVKHLIHPVDKARKKDLLVHLIQSRNMYQALVFARTKHGSNHLAQFLGRAGVSCAAIHGDKSQNQRTRALADFKAGKIQVLVATDIAARGLDIDQLPHVINFELPQVAEDYVHRIGRTGRAGSEGEALSLVCVDELGLLRDIEKLLKRSLPSQVIEGWEVDPSVAAEPIRPPRSGRGNAGNGSPRPASGRTPPVPREQRGEGFRSGPAPRHDSTPRPNTGNRNESPRREAVSRHDTSRGHEGGHPRPPVHSHGSNGRSAQPARPEHRPEVRPDNRVENRPSGGRRAEAPVVNTKVKSMVDQLVGGYRSTRASRKPE